MKKRLVLCALLIGSSCDRAAPARVHAPADSAAGEIPFRVAGPDNGAVIVEVHVNGSGPFHFVLDTGASLTCIDQELARGLNLETTNRRAVGSGVAGARDVRLVRIDSLRVGRASAHALVGCAVQLATLQRLLGADGLLGLNFLKSFRVTLDFERNVLRLADPANQPPAP